METSTPIIRWDYSGPADYTVGTGATQAERLLVYAAGLLVLLLYLFFFFINAFGWQAWQYLLAGLIAADIGAGTVANSLNSCKRFYHTPLQPGETSPLRMLKRPMFFAALHVYPLILGLAFGGLAGLPYGVFWYLALLAATAIVLRTPLYLQRPVATGLVLVAWLVNVYLLAPIPGLEWVMPALFLKIVLAHLVREEPYRPA